MARVQTRRTVSFNRDLYELIFEVASADGSSVSQWVTNLVRERLRRKGLADRLPEQWFGPAGQVPKNAKSRRRWKGQNPTNSMWFPRSARRDK